MKHDSLRELTHGFKGGIFTHLFSPTRTYVKERKYGYPFLGASSILSADLTRLPLISRRDALSRSYRPLQVRHGMTLITSSGVVGRMAYARPDMDGMWSSGDTLKVNPDPEKVLPGYIFAFLGSRFGIPLVVGGTYGSIIQHLEPQHVSDIPIPRIGQRREKQVHELVESAARSRADAAQQIANTVETLIECLGLKPLPHRDVSAYGTSLSSSIHLSGRLDAFYHSSIAMAAEEAVARGRHKPRLLSEVVSRHFKPPIFKRLWVSDPKYGCQFVSGNDAYRYSAEEVRYVSYKTPRFDDFILRRGWLVFQAAGQVYGLFGRPLLVNGWLEDIFCADDVYRIVPQSETDGGFLFAFLKSPHGEVLLKRQASGNSIPRIYEPHLDRFVVPWPEERLRARIGERIIDAHNQIEHARAAEADAITLLESFIEQVGPE